MDKEKIEICGEIFEKDISHFSFQFNYDKICDMFELEKMRSFTNLKSASFNSTNFNDIGIKKIAKNCKNITNLNLQESKISNNGIKYLSQLKKLEVLRLKENEQLTNKCISGLNLLRNLVDLQLHGTSINENGLKKLNLPNLRNLLINEIDKNILIELSRKLSKCTILIKGKFQVLNGKILWKNN